MGCPKTVFPTLSQRLLRCCRSERWCDIESLNQMLSAQDMRPPELFTHCHQHRVEIKSAAEAFEESLLNQGESIEHVKYIQSDLFQIIGQVVMNPVDAGGRSFLLVVNGHRCQC